VGEGLGVAALRNASLEQRGDKGQRGVVLPCAAPGRGSQPGGRVAKLRAMLSCCGGRKTARRARTEALADLRGVEVRAGHEVPEPAHAIRAAKNVIQVLRTTVGP
jgi:hypothetical protein